MTFVTSYVPYIGALISSVFALLIAFGSGGIVPALVMLIVILARNPQCDGALELFDGAAAGKVKGRA